MLGFTEAWVNVFPEHPFRIVSLVVAVLMILFAWIGADFALKIQYVIMALILASIVSFFAGPESFTVMPEFSFDADLRSAEFWKVFAIFFPAVTGIGAGVAMSGDLKDPRRSLPLGIVGAVLAGLVIYLAVAFCYASGVSRQELAGNAFAMADNARWRPLVIVGIMGATLSSALGSIMGGRGFCRRLPQTGQCRFRCIIPPCR